MGFIMTKSTAATEQRSEYYKEEGVLQKPEINSQMTEKSHKLPIV